MQETYQTKDNNTAFTYNPEENWLEIFDYKYNVDSWVKVNLSDLIEFLTDAGLLNKIGYKIEKK